MNLLCECDHTICFVSYQLPSIQALLLSSPSSLCCRSIFQCLPPTSSPTVFWSVLSGSIYLTMSAYSCSFDGPPPKSQVQIHRQRWLLFSFIWEKTVRSAPIDMGRDSEVVSIAISFRCAVTLLSVAQGSSTTRNPMVECGALSLSLPLSRDNYIKQPRCFEIKATATSSIVWSRMA